MSDESRFVKYSDSNEFGLINLKDIHFSNKEDNSGKYLDVICTERLDLRKSDSSDYMNTIYNIFLKGEKTRIGYVNFINDDLEDYIEIQYKIFNGAHRNQGYCTEAVSALIINSPDQLFYIDPINKPSEHVCLKLKRKLIKSGYKCYKEFGNFCFEKTATT